MGIPWVDCTHSFLSFVLTEETSLFLFFESLAHPEPFLSDIIFVIPGYLSISFLGNIPVSHLLHALSKITLRSLLSFFSTPHWHWLLLLFPISLLTEIVLLVSYIERTPTHLETLFLLSPSARESYLL